MNSKKVSQTLFQSLLLGTIASLNYSPIAAANNSQPYPERMIRSLVEVCMKPKITGIFIPFAAEPKAGEASKDKSVARVIEDYQTVLQKTIDQSQAESAQIEKSMLEQIDQRFDQLKEKLKDKATLDSEIKQLQAAIASGMFNGEKITPEGLASLKETEQILVKLASDPTYLETLKQSEQSEFKTKFKARQQQLLQQTTQGKVNLQRCGCTIETLQKRYSLDEVGDRIKQDILGKPGIRQELEASSQSCKALKSN